eukprot:scaffold5645_cov188-Prasinococcus_capsulatus_cf.AAC.1
MYVSIDPSGGGELLTLCMGLSGRGAGAGTEGGRGPRSSSCIGRSVPTPPRVDRPAHEQGAEPTRGPGPNCPPPAAASSAGARGAPAVAARWRRKRGHK